MKKLISILLCLTIVICMTGCGVSDSSDETEKSPNEENNTQSELNTENQENPSETSEEPGASSAAQDETKAIDVDLTELSSTMVYSEVYNMMTEPEKYIGKIIKMKGLFDHYYDEETGNDYFACIIQDATACCAQGIEFELSGNYVYPDDYPEIEEEVCVVGEFDIYEDDEYAYCVLRNARFA